MGVLHVNWKMIRDFSPQDFANSSYRILVDFEKNWVFALLKVRRKSRLFIISSMHCISRNARKLFVLITQRNICSRYKSHSYVIENNTYFEDPNEFYAQKEEEISWSLNLSNLVRQGRPDEAVGHFKMMFMNGHRPNTSTMLCTLKAMGALNSEDLISMAHGMVIQMGFESKVEVLTALLVFYSEYDMEIVWKLFDQIPCKDVVLWSAMVSACVKNGQSSEAFNCFREMQYHDVCPNHASIVSILPACAKLGVMCFGKEIHGFSIRRPFYSFAIVQNSLIDMYAKCHNLKASIRVFEGMRPKDIISWRTIIHACVQNECASKALSIFSRLRSSGFEIKETTIQEMVSVSFLMEDIIFGTAIHCYTLKSGFFSFISIGTALIKVYAKFGEMGSAKVIFDDLNDKDFIAWTAMISASSQGGDPCNALAVFKMMQLTSENPNEITFTSLLLACSSIVDEKLGESIHALAIRSGYGYSEYLLSGLIELYCSFGRMNIGKALFEAVPTKDLICWSSMIKGYGMNGYGAEALQTFSNMVDSGIEPNSVVVLTLLSSCAQCGLDDSCWTLFNSMEERYGISPKLTHYGCMVDLLSRRGNVEQALELVKKMPIKPDKRIWGAILSGCKSTRGSSEIAEFVVGQLNLLEPRNSSYYNVLLNLYAEESRWEDVERVEKLMEEKGLR